MSDNATKSGGIGFCGLLTLLFVVLKAFDKIDWSWWWVFSPLWLPWVLIFGLFIIFGLLKAAID